MKFSIIRSALPLISIGISFVIACLPLFVEAEQSQSSIQKKLAELEASSGGRLGVSAINTANDMRIQYRSEEHFPLASTNKVMGVSAILKKSMTDNRLLRQKVHYKKEDLVVWSPITEKHLADGMTITELCGATMMHSDNTAINLLMKKLGGPKAVTVFARSINDNIFRLDRWEPELNSAIPGDVRDTSTPAAMAKSMQQLVLGDVLALPQRKQLQAWLKGNTVGDSRMRAGAPKGWVVGDKTGTGEYGTTNDVGVIWPPTCAPIVVAIYFTQHKKEAVPRNDVIASATRILIDEFSNTYACK
jgi:beta-lactamase class A